ncbi:AI-2E family transporter [[Pseudomonas] carboxydohydrogena]|uniref:AI-2E family transporter n=1 Tax=Afipia carboxydohydrogena TaxID=290 RepID=A0ABY8BS26_AFICR|nr:AI-2E family transporter [[Pseudomonas] carboxydohydrogena]WEF52141.1 AI-2E family transporter [[Pseudomonas] carboxydohydrogena]
MNERTIETLGEPVPEGNALSPPIIQRAEITSLCLVTLVILAAVAVLYVARAFFLPVVTAIILGTMLSPAAKRLEAFRVPRPVSAALIVVLTWAAFVLMIGLISVPVMDWFGKLPELGPILKDKLHVFDRPLAVWHQLQTMLGTPDTGEQPFQLPKVAWVQPTLEFLSPTFTEILLFFAVLVLFIASWPDLRRALVMNFPNHDSRLRMLKICNAIETNLGNYLLTVTLINAGLGAATGLACAVAHMPNPAGLGGLAATLNFIPIIGPILMFAILLCVGIVAIPTLGGALIAPLAFVAIAFVEGHFVTPTIIGRRLSLNALAVFLALAFWTWLWGPMGAFLSSPLLIVGLIVKEHMMPEREQPFLTE